jgi:hypothetical protein
MSAPFYAIKNAQGEYTLAYPVRSGTQPPADALLLHPGTESAPVQTTEGGAP